MRVKVPDSYHIPAHTHPKPERVTVIQGTFKLAMGENPKKENAKVLPAGTYGTWPPGMVHAVWIEGETIVQFHGMGPWVITTSIPPTIRERSQGADSSRGLLSFLTFGSLSCRNLHTTFCGAGTVCSTSSSRRERWR